MSNPGFVLKATDRPLIADYLAQREAEEATYAERVKVFLASVGAENGLGFNGFDGSRQVTGYEIPTGAEPGEGWRRDYKKWNLAVPAKKTPEGKRIANEVLPELRLAGLGIPDAPWSISAGNVRCWGRVQTISVDYFLIYSEIPENTNANVWGPLWEPVKLSAYHAAIEADEAAKAVSA